MQTTDAIFYVAVLIMSVVIHEVSHGYAAYLLGDNTAKASGRLTLNPLKHLDPLGSVIIPAILVLTHAGFVFGWAKPVPYNERNLNNQRWGSAIVASAGIIANLCVAIIFSILIRISPSLGIHTLSFFYFASTVVLVNVVLAVFNLVPIPPLDGSKILFSFLPARLRHLQNYIERFGVFFLVIFVFFLWRFIGPVIYSLFHLLTGISVS